MNHEKYLQMRSLFLQLEIGEDKKPVWVKQLKQILNNDIHQQPLGCRISGTHIKVGNVHIESFYEAEVLFSHHYWVNCFAKWLEKEIFEVIGNSKEVIIIGYETFIEPVMFLLQDNINTNTEVKAFYGIYEEPKYTQNLGYSKSDTNIKFLDSLDDQISVSQKTPIVFLCGISTTLNTFREMHNKFKEKRPDLENNKAFFFSLIQVLPEGSYEKQKDVLSKETKEDNLDIKGASGSNFTLDEVLTIEAKRKHQRDLAGILDKKGFRGEGIALVKVFEINREKQFDYSLFSNLNYVYSEIRQNEETDTVLVKYLVDAESVWHPAHKCSLCNLSSPRQQEDVPIISTSETSVVPSQMIKSPWYKHALIPREMKKINMFQESVEGDNKHFVFQKYLYYGHIDRMDHHFIYYVRSAHMIKAILDGEHPGMKKQFEDICIEIKDVLKTDDNVIDVIVSPSESGDEVFPCAINRYVFDNKAHTLSIDPNKEFRSNFCTKFSNFGYFIDQIKKWKGDTTPTIRFHYVSKHLIATETFNRVKSLIESLMQKHNMSIKDPESKRILDSIEIFSSVIVFISRNSLSSRYNYISDINRYFSFVDIDIPSIRYYGDACPMCKLSQDVKNYKDACVLQNNAEFWEGKEASYKAKSIETAKELKPAPLSDLDTRYFRRFYFENELYKKTKRSFGLRNYKDSMLKVLSDNKELNIESLISFVKVISSPFLYYQENEKKAALSFILAITKQYLESQSSLEKITIKTIADNEISASFSNDNERYALLVICLNCLSKIDSTFLLSIDTIRILLDVAGKMKIKSVEGEPISPIKFGNIEIDNGQHFPGFLSCIVNNCKRILCGISGDAKTYFFEDELKKHIASEIIDSNESLHRLIKVLYFENKKPKQIGKKFDSEEMLKKYESIISHITKEVNKELKIEKMPIVQMQISLLYCYAKEKDEYEIESFSKGFFKKHDRVKIKENIKECLKIEEGFLFKSDCFIISILSDKKQTILLHFSLADCSSSAIDKFYTLREYLRYSSSLKTIIKPDLGNNLIQLAFQADNAHQLISTGKIISHNGFHDTDELSKIANYLIDQWNIAKDTDQKNMLFTNACRTIHSFMNRCIGFGSITRYVDKYSTNPVDKLDPKRIFTNTCLPMVKDVKCLAKTSYDLPNNFLYEFFLKVFDVNSDYWATLSKDYKKNINSIEVYSNDKRCSIKTLDKLEKTIINPIKHVNRLPKFLNSASYEAKYNWLFLMGILDTLLRNVPEHSEENFNIKFKFSYSANEYKFIIENDNIQEGKTKLASGQTQGFFEFINDSKASPVAGFRVDMDPEDTDDNYVAVVTVKKNPKEV